MGMGMENLKTQEWGIDMGMENWKKLKNSKPCVLVIKKASYVNSVNFDFTRIYCNTPRTLTVEVNRSKARTERK